MQRRGFASADATKGLSDRPLETFGADTPMFLELYRYRNNGVWGCVENFGAHFPHLICFMCFITSVALTPVSAPKSKPLSISTAI